MAEIELKNLTHVYDRVEAVSDFSLQIQRGELVSLLGPSGCGKTTMLRMIAGFVVPTAGQVWLQGRDVTSQPPYKRDTGMVFQDYALFPHLSVFDNISFGLRRRRTPGEEMSSRVDGIIELLQLSGLEQRFPSELSGGQQQRVAVGRALVLNPAVTLLDEPFSNLDAQLRTSTRIELRRLQQELKLTVVFVTHDQEEAMAISDRVVVMNQGRIEQVGTPRDIYERPASRFVASFIGAANVLTGQVVECSDSQVKVRTSGDIDLASYGGDELEPGQAVTVIIRPDDIDIGRPSSTPKNFNSMRGRVEVSSYLGVATQYLVRLPDDTTIVARSNRLSSEDFPLGAEVDLEWEPEAIYVFP